MAISNARKLAANLILQFAEGAITNDDLVDGWPDEGERNDRALKAISSLLWYTYSDTHTHKSKLSPQQSDLYERCYLFLNTDLEYQWKRDNFAGLISLMRILTLGISSFFEAAPISPSKDEVTGPNAIWPFYTKDELLTAKQTKTSVNQV